MNFCNLIRRTFSTQRILRYAKRIVGNILSIFLYTHMADTVFLAQEFSWS